MPDLQRGLSLEDFQAEVRRFARAVELLPGAILKKLGARLAVDAHEIRSRVPKITGTLRDSLEIKRTGPLKLTIGFAAPYASLVDFRVPIRQETTANGALLRYLHGSRFKRIFRAAATAALVELGLPTRDLTIRFGRRPPAG